MGLHFVVETSHEVPSGLLAQETNFRQVNISLAKQAFTCFSLCCRKHKAESYIAADFGENGQQPPLKGKRR